MSHAAQRLRSGPRPHRPAVTLLATATALVLILAGCGSQAVTPGPTDSPVATGSSVPSTAPSVAASPSSEPPSSSGGPTSTPIPSTAGGPTPSPTIARLARDSIAVVVTDDLVVRSKPGVGPDSKVLSPKLGTGREVFVVAGPRTASGYQWYQIEPLRARSDTGDLPFGWVAAASRNGQPWLAAEASACPPLPDDYATFTGTPSLVALACFGNKPISFEARLASPEATCGVDIGWTIRPDWLGSTCPQPKFLVAGPDGTDSWNAVLDPKFSGKGLHPGVEPKDWLDVTVTGHYDHSAARTCRGVSTSARVELTLGEIILSCRSQFVITKIVRS